jgi:ribosomal protein S3AE
VTSAIRRVIRNNVALMSQKLSYERLVEEVITFKLQKHLQGVSSKITPVRNCEIKAFILVERPGAKPITAKQDIDLPVKEEENYDEEETQESSTKEKAEESQSA